MAALVLDCFSDALETGVSISVVLPQSTAAQIGVAGDDGADEADDSSDRPPPVLYLLHGLSDDHTAWMRYTSIERYAGDRGLAVVMPGAARSFYADEAHGHRYWTYLSEELPRLVAGFLNVSSAPEDTFVAGLSMGGYGALKLALTHPDRFAAAASLSGVADLVLAMGMPGRRELRERIYDGEVGADDDLFDLLDRAVATGSVPPLHLSCGTEDWLIEANQRFAETAQEAGVDVTTDWRPGEHEWGLWDAVIREVIAWLPLSTSLSKSSSRSEHLR